MRNRRAIVLVVEDEPLVRFDAVDALQDAGFDVVEAGNADAALAILSARDDITVLFTDINMPGSMNGLQLATEVHEHWPSIHIIVTSGLVKPRRTDIPDEGLFIGKPYVAEHVAAVVEKIVH
jgi:two-component system, response regulator PdtaR